MAVSRLSAAVVACLTKAELQLRDECFDLMFCQIQWIPMGTDRDNADGRAIEPGFQPIFVSLRALHDGESLPESRL